MDDLAVLVEWAQAGEPVAEDLSRGLDELSAEVEAGETKKMLGGEHDRKNAIVARSSSMRRRRCSSFCADA